MKLIEKLTIYKCVDYFGIELDVPLDVHYVVTDGNGQVYGYSVEPHMFGNGWGFSNDVVLRLAVVNLGDTDWRTTCKAV